MGKEWHDINEPGGFVRSSKTATEPRVREIEITDTEECGRAKEKFPAEYRFKWVRAVEPAQGFEIDKPYEIEGEVEELREIKLSRVKVYPIGRYKGVEDRFYSGGIEAYIDGKSKRFRCRCRYLFEPDNYARDNSKSEDATWELIIRAEGKGAEREYESEPLVFPRPVKFQELRRGDYDEEGVKRYGKPEGGEEYKRNGVVQSLQRDLILLGFLPKGSDDGAYGDKTEAAVKSFQEYACKPERMRRKVGKIEKADKVPEGLEINGVVDKRTRDEIDKWIQREWVKPLPFLRKGDVDDEGVRNGKGKRGGDEHYEGDIVVRLQRELQKVKAYFGKIDGWFWDKMKEAVERFQEAAVEGKFVVNGEEKEIGEKLTGHFKGVLDAPTQEMLKKVAEMGGVVEKREENELNLKYAKIMKSLVGKPYIINANGPDFFDCSGAACWGIRKTANQNFGDYTAHELFTKFTKSTDYIGPGSLKFYDYTFDGIIDHVTTIIDNSQMVHPSSGKGVIEIRPVDYLDSYTEKRGGKIYNRVWNWEVIKENLI